MAEGTTARRERGASAARPQAREAELRDASDARRGAIDADANAKERAEAMFVREGKTAAPSHSWVFEPQKSSIKADSRQLAPPIERGERESGEAKAEARTERERGSERNSWKTRRRLPTGRDATGAGRREL